jgi:hypothetical protein
MIGSSAQEAVRAEITRSSFRTRQLFSLGARCHALTLIPLARVGRLLRPTVLLARDVRVF